MESLTKRIIAIVLIAVIGVGIGLGAWFVLAPGAEYEWVEDDFPGAPSGFDMSNIIKIGCAGDTGEIQGDGNWEGAYFAAKEINENGGVVVDGETYYIGVTSEDTDESNPNLVTARGVSAARRLITYKKVDYALGGFRSEALLAYVEKFMKAKMLFIDTGAATDIFCENVRDDYEKYKYFWRFMPINSTSLGGQILGTLAGFIVSMNAAYPTHDVKEIGILAEDLTWVDTLVAAVQTYLPYYTNLTSNAMGLGDWNPKILDPIKYDITLSAPDMNTHLASLNNDGADIVIPVISAQGGILMMQQYAANEYDYLIFGIDVQSQLDTFWEASEGACLYETIMQTLHETNKTEDSLDFWDAFLDEFDHEPLYTAVGAYDAVNGIIDAINATQSFDAVDIIEEMETWTMDNPHPGAGGGGAWWPKTHDLVEGYNWEDDFSYGHTLWCQWQAGGKKKVIPAPTLYPNWMATGAYVIPPWVNATWYVG